jgi:hypothetical protein
MAKTYQITCSDKMAAVLIVPAYHLFPDILFSYTGLIATMSVEIKSDVIEVTINGTANEDFLAAAFELFNKNVVRLMRGKAVKCDIKVRKYYACVKLIISNSVTLKNRLNTYARG